jgi:ribosome-associated protein
LEARALADRIAGILEDKKARDVAILDIKDLTVMAEYFVVCTGTSNTHIRTLSEEVEAKLEAEGLSKLRKEGYDSLRWVLLDYGDVVVHVFHEEDRAFYNLERLWADYSSAVKKGKPPKA